MVLLLLPSDLLDSSNHNDRKRAREGEREQGNSEIWTNGESKKGRASGVGKGRKKWRKTKKRGSDSN